MTCSAVIVVDELPPQVVVDKRGCKRPSRLRTCSVSTHPTFTRQTVCEFNTVLRPKPLLPWSRLSTRVFHYLHTPSTHSVSARSVEILTSPIYAVYCTGVVSNIPNRPCCYLFVLLQNNVVSPFSQKLWISKCRYCIEPSECEFLREPE